MKDNKTIFKESIVWGILCLLVAYQIALIDNYNNNYDLLINECKFPEFNCAKDINVRLAYFNSYAISFFIFWFPAGFILLKLLNIPSIKYKAYLHGASGLLIVAYVHLAFIINHIKIFVYNLLKKINIINYIISFIILFFLLLLIDVSVKSKWKIKLKNKKM